MNHNILKKTIICLCLFMLLLSNASIAQTITLYGKVIDKQKNRALENATICIDESKTNTNSEGLFSIDINGNHKKYLLISCQNYKTMKLSVEALNLSPNNNQVSFFLDNVVSKTGLTDTVFINKANDITMGTYYNFKGTDVARFAGTSNDIARLPQLLINANAIDDRNNNISFRSNSPLNVLWQVEGIGATYLSHFATLGNVGGSHSILNADAIENVDVHNASLSPDLGNNLGGAIDVQLRKGNLEKFQGKLDLNSQTGGGLVLDGPFTKGSKHSFLLGFRNSLNFISNVSNSRMLGWAGKPNFNDWVFNLNTQHAWGTLSFFGYGGTSSIDVLGENAKVENIEDRSDLNSYYHSNSFAVGIKQVVNIEKHSQWQTIFSYSKYNNTNDIYKNDESQPNSNGNLTSSEINEISTFRVKSTWFTHYNSNWSFRIGTTVELPFFNSNYQILGNNSTTTLREGQTNIFQMQVYASTKYTPDEKLAITFGLGHLNFQPLNKTDSLGNIFSPLTILPRLSVAYQFIPNHTITATLGAVDQVQSSGVYLQNDTSTIATYKTQNLLLNFNRAFFWMLNYQYVFDPVTTFDLTVFDQDYFNLPIEKTPSGFSGINYGLTNSFPTRTNLLSIGEGRTFGFEATLSRKMFDTFYFVLNGGYMNSTYIGSDKVERQTAFHSRFNCNLLVGKRFDFNNKHSIDLNLKFSFRNGAYYTRVDISKSIATGTEVLNESQTLQRFYPDYYRFDAKIAYSFSSEHNLSHSFGFELIHFANVEDNFYREVYNPQTQETGTALQAKFIPILFYKLHF
jgi:hypothetical protein